jgi:phage FluMu gp28-like protein
VKLDEFALHKAQRELYRVAKPVIQWGGTLSVISTHRGRLTVFNELIQDIEQKGNPMGWSLHTVPIQRAVEDGIVERINKGSGGTETREEWLARQRAECIDEEQWLQEYCCIPADDSSAFITYEMIAACEDAGARKDFEYLLDCKNPLYIGFDVARKQHLSVIDVEEKVGDVYWERLRIELRGRSFAEQKSELYRLLRLPQVRRCCIDATGIGNQLAEEAQTEFSWKIEPIMFTQQSKSDLAYPLKAAFEDRTLRFTKDAALAADLRGIKKEITIGGNERFVGESGDSHCDRFWSKALAVHAGKAPAVTPFAHVVNA